MDQRARRTPTFDTTFDYVGIISGEIQKINEKLAGEIFPNPVSKIRSTISVMRPEGNIKSKLQVLGAVRKLDELCGYPRRTRPAEPARGVLFFDYIPAETTVELAEYAKQKVNEQDEKTRVAGFIVEMMDEIELIVNSEEMMQKMGSPADRTFMVTLHEAVEMTPRISDITRPPLTANTEVRLVRIVAEVDDFADLHPLKTVDEPLEPDMAQLLIAVRMRNDILPGLKRRQMDDLRTAAQYIDAYRSYVVPAGHGSQTLDYLLQLLERAQQKLVNQTAFNAPDFFQFNDQISMFSRAVILASTNDIIPLHKKKLEVDEQRRMEIIEERKREQEKQEADEIREIGANTKGVPELVISNVVRLRDLLRAPVASRDLERVNAIKKTLAKITEKVGAHYFEYYQLDVLTPAELEQLTELLILPASSETITATMGRVLEMSRYLSYFPTESAGLPIEKIDQMVRIYTTGTAAAKQTLLQGQLARDVMAAVIRFEGLQFNNRRYRRANLPEPFEDLPLAYLQTEVFLQHTVERVHAGQETHVAVQNIDQFIAFDAELKREKRITSIQRNGLGLDRVTSLLRDLRRGYDRTGRLTYKQRQFVLSLCREYQKKAISIL